MGFLRKKGIDRSRLVLSYIMAGLCMLLIVGNVAAFLLMPKITGTIAVLLSNVITILLMLIAIRPLNVLIQKEFDKKADELAMKAREQKEMQERIATLESENRELSSRLDTVSQTSGLPANVNFSFKVETMTYDKSGYIVKEEPLERFLEDPAYKIADKKGLGNRITRWIDDNLNHPGQKRVLYIGKYYIKASIGIDFTKVKFSLSGDSIILYGVRFTKLNDLAINRSDDDVNHCWLLSDNEFETTINRGDFYREFTQEYARLRAEEADAALEEEVDNLCNHYTAVFRENLSQRFPAVAFCDSIDDSTASWFSLKEHLHDGRILGIASNMFLMADVMSDSLKQTPAQALPQGTGLQI
ncbi:MAG: hypothetical protein IJM35_04695 [Bacteroidales bacterium]|nr:hypothetical protein [Bacteroidales bacterium]